MRSRVQRYASFSVLSVYAGVLSSVLSQKMTSPAPTFLAVLSIPVVLAGSCKYRFLGSVAVAILAQYMPNALIANLQAIVLFQQPTGLTYPLRKLV